MTLRPVFALLLLSATVPQAFAQTGAPLVLSPSDMDMVTAGTTGQGAATADATGALAITQTISSGFTLTSTMNNQPYQTSYGAVGNGTAQAIAVGPGAVTGTAAGSAAQVPGNFVLVFRISATVAGLLGSISTSTTAASGNFVLF